MIVHHHIPLKYFAFKLMTHKSQEGLARGFLRANVYFLEGKFLVFQPQIREQGDEQFEKRLQVVEGRFNCHRIRVLEG